MNKTELKAIWKKEENVAHIRGWDFSHIHGRYEEEMDLPWNYEKIIKQYLKDTMTRLDYDTGGGDNDRDLVEMVLPNTEGKVLHLQLQVDLL